MVVQECCTILNCMSSWVAGSGILDDFSFELPLQSPAVSWVARLALKTFQNYCFSISVFNQALDQPQAHNDDVRIALIPLFNQALNQACFPVCFHDPIVLVVHLPSSFLRSQVLWNSDFWSFKSRTRDFFSQAQVLPAINLPVFSNCSWHADLGGETILRSLQVDLALRWMARGRSQAVLCIFQYTLEHRVKSWMLYEVY